MDNSAEWAIALDLDIGGWITGLPEPEVLSVVTRTKPGALDIEVLLDIEGWLADLSESDFEALVARTRPPGNDTEVRGG